MDANARVITGLPLQELWRADGFVSRERGSFLTTEEITELLRIGPVYFVVADCGKSPDWIAPRESYAF